MDESGTLDNSYGQRPASRWLAMNSLLLWCCTDRGTVQKVIVLPRDDLQTEELVLEEVEVFKVSSVCCAFIFISPCHLFPELMNTVYVFLE